MLTISAFGNRTICTAGLGSDNNSIDSNARRTVLSLADSFQRCVAIYLRFIVYSAVNFKKFIGSQNVLHGKGQIRVWKKYC